MNEKDILKNLRFSFDMSICNYQIDTLQNRLLEFYIRADPKFRKAFNINYTNDFLQFMKDKAKLREPIHLSIMGQTRSGKSYVAVSLCVIHSALNGRLFTADYICGNVYEFMEKLKSMPEEMLINSIFLIDEQKNTVFGIGSTAKKMKVQDLQNIIAINNISTIMLTPTGWANKDSFYGLRTFGRCFNTKTVRLMLYNLQERGKGGELPMGNVYLPIFTSLLPEPYASKLEDDYLALKKEWVRGEMRGEGDALGEIKRQSAENFLRDEKFMKLKKKRDRLTYIGQKLGSEWTKSEIEEIESITGLLKEGLLDSD